jgi:tetratricopeptide (TPR) repeat protein
MDHANIARVLDGGTTTGGRPYFVMDLVKGIPITRYCDEHHLTPRQRLELFIPVCQAIQHAHQKGIIHRDIKPSNVLVALYDGKPVPKVIDFGVAKAAGQSLTDKTLVTGFGNIVGTLEYMSPEQAEINQLDIDTRSDIYSLGVLLYELLAGSPPFSRKELEKAGMLEMLRVIREQEPTRPSTKLSTAEGLPTLAANRGMEPARLTKLVRGELDWIVMKALEKDRSRRYETANGFAMDVQRYLADEPVLACPPSAWYRFRKLARRNKRALAVVGLTLFFIALLGGAGGWMARDRAAREQRLTGQVELILDEVDRLEREQKWPEALAANERAEVALAGGEAGDAIRQRVAEARRALEFVARLHWIRQERGAASGGGKVNNRRAVEAYAQAFREYGVDVEKLPVETAVARLQANPSLAVPLAAALDDWAIARSHLGEGKPSWRPLVAASRRVDPDPLRDRLRGLWGERVSPQLQAELRKLAESIEVKTQSPGTLVALAGTLRMFHSSDLAVRILRDGQYAYPRDFWLSQELGFQLHQDNDPVGAARYYSVAVSIRPDSASAHNNLGLALADHKKLNEAIAEYGRAIQLDHKHTSAWSNRGNAYHGLKQYDKALADYSKAIELKADFAEAWSNRGSAYRDLKQYDRALADCSKAIELDPKDAAGWTNRGATYAALRQHDKALADCSKAIEVDPTFAVAWNDRGLVYHDLRQYDKALADYSKAIELKADYAKAWSNRGNAYRDLKQYDKALADCSKAIELDPKLAVAWNDRGLAYHDLRQYDKALADYSKAIDLDPKWAPAWSHRGAAHAELRQYDKAVADYSMAIELDPRFMHAWANRGIVYCDRLGQPEKAVADFSKAIELEPKSATLWSNRGNAHRKLRQYKQASADHSKAIELDPKLAIAWEGRALDYYLSGQYEKAVADCSRLLELDWTPVRALSLRGSICCDRLGQPEKAVADFTRAIQLEPENAVHWDNRGNAYRHLRQYDKAVADYSKAIELNPGYANGHNGLAWLLAACPDARLRDPRRAVGLAGKAVRLAPQNGGFWNTLGVARYRAGDWRGAAAALDRSRELSGGGDASDWLFLAMAHRKLGHDSEARRAYDRAIRWLGGHPELLAKDRAQTEELRRFRSEAEDVLGLKK